MKTTLLDLEKNCGLGSNECRYGYEKKDAVKVAEELYIGLN